MFDVELGGGGISCKYYHRQYKYNQISAALLLQDKKIRLLLGCIEGLPYVCGSFYQKCFHYLDKNAFITLPGKS